MSVATQEDVNTSVEGAARDYFDPATGRVGPAETPRPEGVVALPRVGEVVALTTRTGAVQGYWIGLPSGAEQPTFPDGRIRVRILTGGEVAEHELEASALEAEHVVGQAEGAIADAVVALATAYQQKDHQRLGHEQWRQLLTAGAHEEADAREWCSDFDDFMEQVGLDRRGRTYACEVAVSTCVTVHVDASSQDAAENSITRDLVMGGVSLENLEWEINSTWEA
jgi:hypothetical protein